MTSQQNLGSQTLGREDNGTTTSRSWWLSGAAALALACCQGCLVAGGGYYPCRVRPSADVPAVEAGTVAAAPAVGGATGRLLLGSYGRRPYSRRGYGRNRNRRAQTSKWSVNFGGPRMGLIVVTGEAAQQLKAAYDVDPVLTAWGWQFEWQYETSQDGPVGLIEVVPLIAGLDKGVPFPSGNLLLGLRRSDGLEFSAGPNASPSGVGMTVAFGKTFKAGELNMPVNLAVVSNKSGLRYSVTFGWNLRQ
jgi:hypothetical protein